MFSESCRDPPNSNLSLTDFQEFVNCIVETNACGKKIVEQVDSILSTGLVSLADVQLKQDYGAMIVRLLGERRDLNAHYGWVLASDAAPVAKSLGVESPKGTFWAREWMRVLFEEYEHIGKALAGAAQTLGTGQAQE